MKLKTLFVFIPLTMGVVASCTVPIASPGIAADGEVSFAMDVQPILNAHCVFCHQPGGFAALSGISLDLRAREGLDHMLGVPSLLDADEILVVPGNVSASFLFDKIASAPPRAGARMPPNGALREAEIEVIRVWIEQGANP